MSIELLRDRVLIVYKVSLYMDRNFFSEETGHLLPG